MRYLSKGYELIVIQGNFFEYWDTRYNEKMKDEIINNPKEKIKELKEKGWRE